MMNRIFGFVAMIFLMAMAFFVQPQEALAVLMYGSENFDGVLAQYWAQEYTDADTGMPRVTISVGTYTRQQNIYWGEASHYTDDNIWEWKYTFMGKYEPPQYHQATVVWDLFSESGMVLNQRQVTWGLAGIETLAGAEVVIYPPATLEVALFTHDTWSYNNETYFGGKYFFQGKNLNHPATPEPMTAGLSILGLSALGLAVLRRRQC